MKIAIHGLGKMGMQIARKLSVDGHQVIAHNRSPGPIAEAVAFGAVSAASKEDVLAAFEDTNDSQAPNSTPNQTSNQIIIWLMLPASVTETEITAWLKVLPRGSLLIDGGNSDFRNTQRHLAKIEEYGVDFLDVGTSGGILGQANGFCMMAGGNAASYAHVEPILKSLAAPSGAYQYFGPSGSGHYVKMVHNAIEYGMMQSLAEGYRALHEGPYPDIDLAKAGEVWKSGSVIASLLNDLATEALRENPTLEGIDGFVAENGEARWTLEVASQKGIAMPSIQASLDVRLASQQGETNFSTKLLAAMRNKFGGHAINK